jgi:hypothetical protein
MYRRTKLLAAFIRAVAAILTVSVAAAGVPAAAQEAGSAAPSALRQSIDRAVDASASAQTRAALSDAERADVAQRARRLQTDPVAGQASGGGAGRTIMTVLGLAASAWSTWYMVQWMKKQQEKEQTGIRR